MKRITTAKKLQNKSRGVNKSLRYKRCRKDTDTYADWELLLRKRQIALERKRPRESGSERDSLLRSSKKLQFAGTDGSESQPKWNPIEIAFAAAKIWIAIALAHTHRHTHTHTDDPRPHPLFRSRDCIPDPESRSSTVLVSPRLLGFPWLFAQGPSRPAQLVYQSQRFWICEMSFPLSLRLLSWKSGKCGKWGKCWGERPEVSLQITLAMSLSFSDSNARTWQID